MRFPSSCFAVLAVIAALAIAAPAADAQPFAPGAGLGGAGAGACGQLGSGPDSGLAGVNTQTCLGSGLVFNGPSIGRIATVIGPTIITPGGVGAVAVSAGSVFMAPGAGSQNIVP
jgi:hypothetical protein